MKNSTRMRSPRTASPNLAAAADLEDREERELAGYAAKSRASRGRRYSEPEDPRRTMFQRDRDRIIHSTAFRRLEYKTQVFVNHEGDHYRTRLTHTIEVAQIARTLARSLRLNEDLAESVALAHDLGHPPFGHSGERALQECMRDHGGFEHNVQALRVVDRLESRYPDREGLNLTYEVRESILKHPGSNAAKEIVAEFGGEPFPLLEAQVVDISDLIAYNNHDIDDGLYSGLVTEEELHSVPLFRAAFDEVGEIWPGLDPKVRRRRIVARMIDQAVTDLVHASVSRIAESGISTPQEAREVDRYLIGFSEEFGERQQELASFLAKRLYGHYRVMRMAAKADRFIRRMFEAYREDSNQLPPGFADRAEECGLNRSICDYIAGMTDRYAQDCYKKMFHPFERI